MAEQAVAALQAATAHLGVSVTGASAETPVIAADTPGLLTTSFPAGSVSVSLPGSPTKATIQVLLELGVASRIGRVTSGFAK